MGTKIFKGNSLEECLERAHIEMNLPSDKLNYKVVEERKGLFKKTITISVEEPIEDKPPENGRIIVRDGKILIEDPEEGGKSAILSASNGISVTVNGELINGRVEVYHKDEIEYNFEELESQRFLDVKVSQNRLEAYIAIKYVPLTKYKLKETEGAGFLTLEREIQEEIYPPLFTVDDVKTELSKLGIKFGLRIDELDALLKSKAQGEFLVAKGKAALDDTNDVIDYKFGSGKNAGMNRDDNKSIDYRNWNMIVCVKKGDLIAEKIQGKVGSNGTDIYGNVLTKKEGKKINLKVGPGCEIKENTVIATVDGRPNEKNHVICVNEIYEVPKDVDMKTGNVKFVGDVKIFGNVTQGMKVEAGGAINIEKDVESSNIVAVGDVIIKGNILSSKVTAGGQDVISQRRIKDLEVFIQSILSLEENVLEIKKFNLLGYNKEDGEIIKVLLETKFKTMNKTCINIIKDSVYDEYCEIDGVVSLIRQMLVGMAPLGIKHFTELDRLVEASKEKLDVLSENLSLPVDVNISYCQDCNVSSSGDIYITGRGEYVSNILAHNSIIFTYDKGIARGGELQAGKEIKCKMVGSTGGVLTKLSVSEQGHIWADVAYHNTKICIGNKEVILEMPFRNIHAYIDSTGDLMVEKLKL